MEEIRKFKNIDENTRKMMIEWFLLTGEVLTALTMDGYTKQQAVQMLRGILVQKNLKYIDA